MLRLNENGSSPKRQIDLTRSELIIIEIQYYFVQLSNWSCSKSGNSSINCTCSKLWKSWWLPPYDKPLQISLQKSNRECCQAICPLLVCSPSRQEQLVRTQCCRRQSGSRSSSCRSEKILKFGVDSSSELMQLNCIKVAAEYKIWISSENFTYKTVSCDSRKKT